MKIYKLEEKVSIDAIKAKAKGIVLELNFRNMLNKRFIPYNKANIFYKLFAEARELYLEEKWSELDSKLSEIKQKLEPYKKEFKDRL